MPVILIAWEVDIGRLWFEASLGKVSMRSNVKNKLKSKRIGGHDSSGRA
jgi:hypothetical protein